MNVIFSNLNALRPKSTLRQPLLSHESDFSQKDPNKNRNALFKLLNQTPVTENDRAAHTTKVSALLNQNPSLISATDDWGNTPLHLAAKYGHQHSLQTLIKAGANIDAQTNEAAPPLHIAANNRQQKNLQTLINAEANKE